MRKQLMQCSSVTSFLRPTVMPGVKKKANHETLSRSTFWAVVDAVGASLHVDMNPYC